VRNDAKAAPAELLSAAAVHPGAGRSAVSPASLCACEGNAAPAGGRLGGALAALGLVALALLGFSAADASAAYVHPEVTYEFGTDGTSGTEIPQIDSLTYNQATDQVMVLSKGSPRHIYAFDFNAPESFTPSGSPFPLEVGGSGYDSQIDVDNSGTSSAGNIFYSEDGSSLYGFSSSGSALGAFSPEGGEKCGAAVDKNGHPWSGNFSGGRVEEFNWSGGAPIATVDVSGQGSPCHLLFDRSNNDLYVSMYYSGLWRYTAASDYSPSSAVKIDPGGNTKIAINSLRHVIYVARGGTVKAYDTATGSLLEEFATSYEARGIAVDDSSDTVFTANTFTDKIQEWKGVIIPDVTTGEPGGNSELTGSVELAGGPEVTECKFEWKKKGAGAYEGEEPCTPAAPYGADQPLVSAEPALEDEQTYEYRLVAANENGTSYGRVQTITPHYVPLLETGGADEVERDTATLHATFEGNGEDTTFFFEYGVESVEENSTDSEDAGSLTGPASVSEGVEGLTAGTTYQYRVVATNGLGTSTGKVKTFETDQAVKEIQTNPATDVEPTSAILNGSLNPDGYETTFFFEYGKSTAYGQKAPLTPQEVASTAPGTVNVSTELTDLEPGTSYHYRIVASNSTGTTVGNDQSFETPQGPSILSFSSRNLTETTVELTGLINPNGYETTYWFEYGTTTNYGSKAPVPAGTIEAGNSVEEVVVQLTGLLPSTYHFRLVAESVKGKTATEDQTFEFNPPESCPNSAVRQLTGAAYLPDCRAYELVSPSRAGGAALHAIGPYSPFTSAGRFSFVGTINGIPGTGEPMNAQLGDLYISTRTATGWTTKYVGRTGWQSSNDGPMRWKEYIGNSYRQHYSYGGIPFDLSMSKFVIFDWGNRGELSGYTSEGNNVPYVYDNEGHEIGRLPTNFEEVPGSTTDLIDGGFIGDSALSGDGRHYIFGARELAFTPQGLAEPPGSIYDNDIATGSLTVISKTESGEDIPTDPLAGSGREFILIPAVSTDGSHVLMSTKAPGGKERIYYSFESGVFANEHLYMSINDHEHFDVSKGEDGENHAVSFAGMTEDGSEVYFTSAEQLTAEDTDSSVDIYRWDSATHETTLVSKGSTPGSGNGTSCSPIGGWTGGCSAEVVPARPYHPAGLTGTAPADDTVMALRAGDIYFYSPEQLDGARGLPNARNLYVYRNGSVHFVATLESNQGAERMNVSPDGSHMALITRSPLTAYDSAGHTEMYVYDAVTRSIRCVSCRPDGNPPISDVEGSQDGIFMTEDGRAFFSTKDSLVDIDTDGVSDVYEFVDGRPQLISSGTAETEGNEYQQAGLVGVTEDGIDAFFSTFSTFVPEDENGGLMKFYDARTNGGFPFNKPAAPCAAADECHGASSSAPANPVIGTGANLGERGNLHPAKHHRHHRRHRRHHRCKRGHHCHKKKSGHRKHGRGRRHG
jgi:hypothetical protein